MKRMEMAMAWSLGEPTAVQGSGIKVRASHQRSAFQELWLRVSRALNGVVAVGRRMYWFLCGVVWLRWVISGSCLSLFALSVVAEGWTSVKPLSILPVLLAGLLTGVRGGVLIASGGIPALVFGVALWNGDASWSVIDVVYVPVLIACGAVSGRLRVVSARLCKERTDAQKIEAGARIREMKLRALINRYSVNEERARLTLVARFVNELDHIQAQVKDTLACLAHQLPDSPQSLNDTQSAMDDAFHSVREQAYRFTPTALHSIGLEAALDWLSASTQRFTGVRVRYTRDPERMRIDADLSILIFQVTRELLENALQHAHAGMISIALTQSRQQVVVTVTDDGVGFDVAVLGGRPCEKDGLGLFGVEERVSGVGGAVEILSRPGAGTCVVIRAPLTRQ